VDLLDTVLVALATEVVWAAECGVAVVWAGTTVA